MLDTPLPGVEDYLIAIRPRDKVPEDVMPVCTIARLNLGLNSTRKATEALGH